MTTRETQIILPGSVTQGAVALVLYVSLCHASVWSAHGSKILYVSSEEGGANLYVVNADGSALRNLTHFSRSAPYGVYSPTWSPDGSKIAFSLEFVAPTRASQKFREIWVISVDSSSPANVLLGHEAPGDKPAWSPDGTKIAFESTRDNISQIYVMNADGSNQRNVSRLLCCDYSPVWSPNGRQIAFRSYRESRAIICTMDARGSARRALTGHKADAMNPSWSPNGTKIAFTSNRDAGWEVYVMDADGANQRRLTYNTVTDYPLDPAWSPDGTKIAYESRPQGNYEIYTVGADGTKPVNLTKNSAQNHFEGWSPDGRKIIFNSDRSGTWEEYVMNANGSSQRRLSGR